MKIFGAPRKNFLLAALMSVRNLLQPPEPAKEGEGPLMPPIEIRINGMRSMHPRKAGPGRRGRPRAGKHAPSGLVRPDATLRKYGARYSNVLTAWNTDRNLAAMAKRKLNRNAKQLFAKLDRAQVPMAELREAA